MGLEKLPWRVPLKVVLVPTFIYLNVFFSDSQGFQLNVEKHLILYEDITVPLIVKLYYISPIYSGKPYNRSGGCLLGGGQVFLTVKNSNNTVIVVVSL